MRNWIDVARRAAARYRFSRNLRHYAYWKARVDPAYRFLVERLNREASVVLDVGCGAGVLGACLIECGYSGRYVGIDPDEGKVAAAQRALDSCGLTAERCVIARADALAMPDHRGNVVVLDVIHYLSPAQRGVFFQEVAGRIGPGDSAWIRTTLADESWRFRITRFEEWFVRASGWIPIRSHSFPERRELEEHARAAGLSATIEPLWGRTPFNSYLITLTLGGSAGRAHAGSPPS